ERDVRDVGNLDDGRVRQRPCDEGAERWRGLGIILRRDDERRDAAFGDVPDRTRYWWHVPDDAVRAHELEVRCVPVDGEWKRRKRAPAGGDDAPSALVGHPLAAGDTVVQPIAEDADAGGIELDSRPRGCDRSRVAVRESVDRGGDPWGDGGFPGRSPLHQPAPRGPDASK